MCATQRFSGITPGRVCCKCPEPPGTAPDFAFVVVVREVASRNRPIKDIVESVEDGVPALRITIRKSETDQEGRARRSSSSADKLPVRSRLSRRGSTPRRSIPVRLFCQVRKGEKIGERLSEHSASAIEAACGARQARSRAVLQPQPAGRLPDVGFGSTNTTSMRSITGFCSCFAAMAASRGCMYGAASTAHLSAMARCDCSCASFSSALVNRRHVGLADQRPGQPAPVPHEPEVHRHRVVSCR